MNVTDALALFAAMLVLAAVPGVSVMAVSARAMSSGFLHGAVTAAGVVAGDLVFILLAVFGLVLLVEALGDGIVVLRYVAGAYLVWLGWRLWLARHAIAAKDPDKSDSLWSAFFSGLLLTLADQKAVFFYLAFLPAFMDLARVSPADLAVLIAITILAVGGVKLVYVYIAVCAAALPGVLTGGWLNALAALAMALAGVMVVLR